MKTRKIVNTMIFLLVICLLVGIGAFIYNAINVYKINESFTSIPLQFDPDDSSSAYQMQDSRIVVYGGFIKGIQRSNDGTGGIVIRALSPLPKITIEGSHSGNVQILIENINPEFYAKQITGNKLQTSKLKANTLQVNIPFAAGKTVKFEPLQPSDTEKDKYVILGDNRNGYDTFDYAGSHFAFLDSSPGWAERKTISEGQYAWLERDLKKAQGKNIFVVTHIPPHDPRSGKV